MCRLLDEEFDERVAVTVRASGSCSTGIRVRPCVASQKALIEELGPEVGVAAGGVGE